MATNRYGDFNTQPLYNATGRLNRGPEVGSTQFQAPNSGANRQWGSNQGMPTSGINPIMNSLTSYWSPVNMYDMARFSDRGMYDRKTRRGGQGPRGGVGGSSVGGGGGGGSTTVVPEGGQPYTVSGNTNIQIGGDITFAEQNRQASTKNITATAVGGAPGTNPAQPAARAPRAPRTAEQKAARNAKDRERRAAAKANPKPTTAPASPVSSGGASNTSSDSVQANQVANPVYNTSIGGMQGRPAAQSPQAPGASGFGAPQNMFNITGGTVNAPTPPTKGRSRKAR